MNAPAKPPDRTLIIFVSVSTFPPRASNLS
jgi:hypothetical protein